MDIHFQGQFTWRDLYRAVLLANKPVRAKLLIRYGFALAAVLFYIGYFLWLGRKDPSQGLASAPLVTHISSLILVLLYLLYPLLTSTVTAMKLWGSPSMHERISGTLSEEGIQYTGKKTLITWSRISRYHVKPDLIVFLTGEGVLCFFPRSLFISDGDWLRLNQLVHERFEKPQVIDI